MMRTCGALIVIAVLAVGVTDASATTLFTTSSHTTGVSLGATVDLTATQSFAATFSSGTVAESCSDVKLHATISENSGFRVTFSVFGSSFSGCNPYALAGTFPQPWRITVSGTGAVLGTSTRFVAAIDDMRVDFTDLSGAFSLSSSTGVTATQPTVGAAPICIDLSSVGPVTGPVAGLTLDGRFCPTGAPASTWSLT
jgi:hypothetical protein